MLLLMVITDAHDILCGLVMMLLRRVTSITQLRKCVKILGALKIFLTV